MLVEGAIEFFSASRGRETTLSFLMPPGAFILAAVVLDQLYLKSARTTESTMVVLIPALTVRDVFNKDPAFARAERLHACPMARKPPPLGTAQERTP